MKFVFAFLIMSIAVESFNIINEKRNLELINPHIIPHIKTKYANFINHKIGDTILKAKYKYILNLDKFYGAINKIIKSVKNKLKETDPDIVYRPEERPIITVKNNIGTIHYKNKFNNKKQSNWTGI